MNKKTAATRGVVLTVCFTLCAAGGCGQDEVEEQATGSTSQAASFVRALPIPPVLTPTSTDATTDYYDIEAKPGTSQIRSSGPATPIWGYNGTYPGPTIVATRGRQVKVTQRNGLSVNTTVHNHGHKVAPSSDGHPTDYIKPGASKVYTYPNDQSAATFWYHDHTMDVTGKQVYQGLAGFYIIRDPAENALNLPSGAYDVPLIIQDKKFNADNTLFYSATDNLDNEGFLGNVGVVNGVETPNFNVANRKYRFRLLNGSNARWYALSLTTTTSNSFGGTSTTSHPFKVIASDGALLAAPVSVTSLKSAPAERYDVVVDFSKFAIGTKIVMRNADDSRSGGVTELMQFTVDRSEQDTSTVPSTLATVTRFTRAQAVSTFEITFDNNREDWTLNGKTYDPARIDVQPKLNTVYIWKLKNRSGEMHPFHKHLVEFNVLSVNGNAPAPVENGWKDTVAVPAWGEAEIIFKNEAFTGIYVYHCHRLEHEDHRMMAQENVVP